MARIDWGIMIQGIHIIDLNNLDDYDVREYYYVRWQKESNDDNQTDE